MPTVPPQSYLEPQREDRNLSGGAIGGIAAGVIGGVALLAGLIFFLIRRHKKSGNDVERSSGSRFSPVRKWIPGRQASVLSRTGLLTSEPAPPPTEKPDLFVNTSHTQMSRRPSVGASVMMGDSAPHSASTAAADKRNSRLMFFDQRMNPNALMLGDNGSQTSIGTIQDNRDYTRPLGVSQASNHLFLATHSLLIDANNRSQIRIHRKTDTTDREVFNHLTLAHTISSHNDIYF